MVKAARFLQIETDKIGAMIGEIGRSSSTKQIALPARMGGYRKIETFSNH